MQNNPTVLIVGAGPTGLTAAVELSRFGISTRIIDKAPDFTHTSKALTVQSRTLELFGQRGLLPAMLAGGNRAKATTIYSHGKVVGRIDLQLIPSRYNYALLLPQADTEEILRKKAQEEGVTLEWSTEMTDLEQQADGSIKATLTRPDGSPEEVLAAYLISAEGAHSTARHRLNLTFEGITMPQNFALGDVYLEGDIPDDELCIFVGETGFVGTFPMQNRRFRILVTDPDNHVPDAAPPTLNELQGIFDAIVKRPARMHDMVWSSRYRVNSRKINTLRVGNVFLGGDAAHIHSPAGGQGMNTGIQDMINLGWKLAYVLKGWAKPELLDSYHPERMSIIKSVVATTEKVTDLMGSHSSLVQWLIRTLLPPLLRLEAVQKKGTAIISEVANEYNESPLTQKGRKIGTLEAGMRLPDTNLLVDLVDLKTGERQPAKHLYDVLDPCRFTRLLINVGNERPWQTDLAGWQAMLTTFSIVPATERDQEEFNELFGEDSAVILVRPDSYIVLIEGGQGGPTGKDSYEWMNKWLLGGADSKPSGPNLAEM